MRLLVSSIESANEPLGESLGAVQPVERDPFGGDLGELLPHEFQHL